MAMVRLPRDFRDFLKFLEVEINVISLPDLRANKAAAGRHKDLDDLEHLPSVP